MPGTLGILGGTFNPPHLGHLAAAAHARDQLGLERVVLMPTHTPPHKPAEDDPGPLHRLQMCRLAVAGTAGLSVCAAEIERGGPSYTVDTLRAIHASQPDLQLTLIVGADMARTLPGWRDASQLLGLARIAVAGRDDVRQAEIEHALTAAGGDGARGDRGVRVHFLEMPPIDVSSSFVRRLVAAGQDVVPLVGAAVAGYIEGHGLYRRRAPSRVRAGARTGGAPATSSPSARAS